MIVALTLRLQVTESGGDQCDEETKVVIPSPTGSLGSFLTAAAARRQSLRKRGGMLVGLRDGGFLLLGMFEQEGVRSRFVWDRWLMMVGLCILRGVV